MITIINYLKCGMIGARDASVTLLAIVIFGFVFIGWPAATIIPAIFIPGFLFARYEVGKRRVERATRRLLGGDRRMRPRRPPPPPNPPPMRVIR